ncbi:MAG: hypothetical protein V9G13_02255 [Marmoricola sp.]
MADPSRDQAEQRDPDDRERNTARQEGVAGDVERVRLHDPSQQA